MISTCLNLTVIFRNFTILVCKILASNSIYVKFNIPFENEVYGKIPNFGIKTLK